MNHLVALVALGVLTAGTVWPVVSCYDIPHEVVDCLPLPSPPDEAVGPNPMRSGLLYDPALMSNSSVALQLLSKLSAERKQPGQLPDSLDYSKDKSRVGPVTNQGDCGSCAAHAMVGALEGQLARLGLTWQGAPIPLSAQMLVDCVIRNCDDGSLPFALSAFVKAHGIKSVCSHPQSTLVSPGKCYRDPKLNLLEGRVAGTLGFFMDPKDFDEMALMRMLNVYGPLIVVLSAKELFDYGAGEIFAYDCDGAPLEFDHAVLLVGYGKRNGVSYFKIRNSWGTTWGEAGYGYLRRGRPHCMPFLGAFIPLVN